MAVINRVLAMLNRLNGRPFHQDSENEDIKFKSIGIGAHTLADDGSGGIDLGGASLSDVGTVNGVDPADTGAAFDAHVLHDAARKHYADEIEILDTQAQFTSTRLEGALDEAMDAAQAADANAETRVKKDGTTAFTADVPFGGFKGVNTADGTVATDVATKGQMDTADLLLLPRSGVRPMTGVLDMGNNRIANVSDAIGDAEVPSWAQVKDHVADAEIGHDWQEDVIDKDLTDPPGAPTAGDRYLLGTVLGGGTYTGAWAGHGGKIAEWDGAAWVFTVPDIGTFVSCQDEDTLLYYFGGATWTAKTFEATTADGFLSLGGPIGRTVRFTNLAQGTIPVGDNTGAPVARAPSGDVTMSDVGAFTIAASAVTNGKLANAAVDEFKIATGTFAEGVKGGGGAKVQRDDDRTATFDAAVAALDIVYLKVGGTWDKARADIITEDTELAVSRAAYAFPAPGAGLVVIRRGARIPGWLGLTPGKDVLVSKTLAGAFTQTTAGMAPDDEKWTIGKAVSATEVMYAPRRLGKVTPVADYDFATAGPGETIFTIAGQSLLAGQRLDVWVNGRLMDEGGSDDYLRTIGGPGVGGVTFNTGLTHVAGSPSKVKLRVYND